MSDADFRAELAEAARMYHEHGLSLLPIKFVGKGQKMAAVEWKDRQDARADLATVVREIQTLPQVDGIACILGAASDGLWGRDFDSEQAYQNWAAAHAAAAQLLPTVKTRSGYHVYARAAGDVGFKNFGGADGELRGDRKHYMMLPPSRHPKGGRYEWVTPLPDNFGDVPWHQPEELGLRQPWNRPLVASERLSELSQSPTEPHRAFTQPVAPPPASVWLCDISTPEDVLLRCKVSGPGESNSMAFNLYRGLKHNGGLALDDAIPWVRRWYGENEGSMSGDHDVDSFLLDMARRWEDARWPLGTDLLEVAMANADVSDLPASLGDASTETKRLVAVAVAMGEIVGSVFGLSATQLARAMYRLPSGERPTQTQRKMAHRRMKQLSRADSPYGQVFIEVKPGIAGPAGNPATKWALGPVLLRE